ncbi:MAG: 3,4-dehydroadipyl-CoA semialdehyde dehydrogenase [Polyangiaceae bacterium]
MRTLPSHLEGRWIEGTGAGQELVNPSTEEAIARVSTEGLDFGRALAFARETGGPALRALTFAERSDLLRGMSRAIHAHRDELLDLAMVNGGNTRSDAKFDVDGASGTLNYYADLGQRLGAFKLLADGDAEQLARSPRFVGQHVRVPRRGVAVHVNAFNFPAWGLGEKAACALLAGMPIVVKPATSTALVAHRIVEIFVEQKLLPDGALSLVAGAPGDLLKHLGGEDTLAFTGGSSTAVTLRSLDGVVRDSVRVNVEADSLNGAILGPDVEVGSDTWSAFLRDVARDMQQKTGQKCTAIRRIFVHADRVADVTDALLDRVGAIVTGNTANDRVTMGPVATRTQQRDVLKGIELLREGAKRLSGEGDFAPVDAPAGKGFFVPPTLFLCDASADAVHRHEVFGPVQSVVPFGSNEELERLVRRGGGGLVCSLYSDDRAFATDVALGIASAHGRLALSSAKIAEQAPGPGTVLPQMVHGGPGRAGGGEELGGLRGLDFYSHRCAIQGDRPVLDAIAARAARLPGAAPAPSGKPSS